MLLTADAACLQAATQAWPLPQLLHGLPACPDAQYHAPLPLTLPPAQGHSHYHWQSHLLLQAPLGW